MLYVLSERTFRPLKSFVKPANGHQACKVDTIKIKLVFGKLCLQQKSKKVCPKSMAKSNEERNTIEKKDLA